MRKFYTIAAIVILCSSVIAGTFLYVKWKYRPLEKPGIAFGFIDIVNESSPDFPKIYLQSEKIEIDPNETAVVNVILVNGSSVAVVDVVMEYDGSIVKVLNVSSKYRFNYSKGYIHNRFIINYLEIEIFLEKPVENNSIIANITLKGLSDGKTAMGFSDLSGLYDKKGELMNRELWGTEITVGMPPNDEIEVRFDFVELLLFVIFYAAVPLSIIFLFVAAIVGTIFAIIAKIKRKKLEDFLYHYLVVSLVISLLVYVIIIFVIYLHVIGT